MWFYFSENSKRTINEIQQKNPVNILSKFDLSPNQTKVYLCLSKNGNKTASQLSRILNIPRTETYALLNILQNKGCIIKKNGKPLKFISVPIENFLENKIDKEKQKILKLEAMLLTIKKFYQSKNIGEETQVIA